MYIYIYVYIYTHIHDYIYMIIYVYTDYIKQYESMNNRCLIYVTRNSQFHNATQFLTSGIVLL